MTYVLFSFSLSEHNNHSLLFNLIKRCGDIISRNMATNSYCSFTDAQFFFGSQFWPENSQSASQDVSLSSRNSQQSSEVSFFCIIGMILSNDTFSRYMMTLYQTPVDLMEFIPDTEIEIFKLYYTISIFN